MNQAVTHDSIIECWRNGKRWTRVCVRILNHFADWFSGNSLRVLFPSAAALGSVRIGPGVTHAVGFDFHTDIPPSAINTLLSLIGILSLLLPSLVGGLSRLRFLSSCRFCCCKCMFPCVNQSSGGVLCPPCGNYHTKTSNNAKRHTDALPRTSTQTHTPSSLAVTVEQWLQIHLWKSWCISRIWIVTFLCK